MQMSRFVRDGEKRRANQSRFLSSSVIFVGFSSQGVVEHNALFLSVFLLFI